MLGASCDLELLEMTEYRHPEENGVMSGLSKDTSSSGVSPESVRMKARPCSKSANAWLKIGAWDLCWFGQISQ